MHTHSFRSRFPGFVLVTQMWGQGFVLTQQSPFSLLALAAPPCAGFRNLRTAGARPARVREHFAAVIGLKCVLSCLVDTARCVRAFQFEKWRWTSPAPLSFLTISPLRKKEDIHWIWLFVTSRDNTSPDTVKLFLKAKAALLLTQRVSTLQAKPTFSITE